MPYPRASIAVILINLRFRSISVNDFFIGHTVEFILSYIIPMLHIYEAKVLCARKRHETGNIASRFQMIILGACNDLLVE